MIGFKLEVAKAKFFDERKVLDPAERAQLKALSKFGAFVRRKAKSLIRKRKAISAAGSPPSSHVGLLKKFIYFFVEKKDRNVIIGPIQLNRGDGTAPRLLEHGGDTVRRRYDRKKQVMGEARRQVYAPRPFMVPAFESELGKAPDGLQGEVR